MAQLTHRGVEQLLVSYMAQYGWERVKNGRFKFGKLQPDRILKKGKAIIVAEVKPENASVGEVCRGIGQSARFLDYDVAPYLVIFLQYWYDLRSVFTKLPWLGVIVYYPKREVNLRGTILPSSPPRMEIKQISNHPPGCDQDPAGRKE